MARQLDPSETRIGGFNPGPEHARPEVIETSELETKAAEISTHDGTMIGHSVTQGEAVSVVDSQTVPAPFDESPLGAVDSPVVMGFDHSSGPDFTADADGLLAQNPGPEIGFGAIPGETENRDPTFAVWLAEVNALRPGVPRPEGDWRGAFDAGLTPREAAEMLGYLPAEDVEHPAQI